MIGPTKRVGTLLTQCIQRFVTRTLKASLTLIFTNTKCSERGDDLDMTLHIRLYIILVED